jgi:DNA-binding beta-propeller fold protein YncE
VTTIAGGSESGFKDGVGTEALFDEPHGVVIDAFGNIIVTDMGNNRIRKITVCFSHL